MLQHSVGGRPRLASFALAVMVAGSGSLEAQTAVEAQKIPITTSSAEARQDYLKGRTLAENLRAHEAREFFLRAAAKDPGFALAPYNLALSAPTAKEFFEQLDRAVALADKASEGERLLILGQKAGANADTRKQQEYYEQLIAKYPRDERAHFQLGNVHFGQQSYEKAIAEYQTAVEIAPDFAPAYNILGYATRQAGRFEQAEQAFKKYIELIPKDPNPYDSYAELLMKMGRYDESIAMYRKALTFDPHFAASFVGIASNLMFQGKHDASRAEAQKLYQAARNDGERRGAMFSATVAYADEGKFDLALKELDKQYALGEGIKDAAAMSGDLVFMGNVLLESGKPDEAVKRFDRAVRVVQASNLSQEVKDNSKLLHHYNAVRAALRKNDLAGAKKDSDAFTKGTTALNNAFQVKLAHELAGMIALQERNFDQALVHLGQASQQDPYNLYRMGLAHEGKGDDAKARQMFDNAANHNTLPTLNYAFIRDKARKMKV